MEEPVGILSALRATTYIHIQRVTNLNKVRQVLNQPPRNQDVTCCLAHLDSPVNCLQNALPMPPSIAINVVRGCLSAGTVYVLPALPNLINALFRHAPCEVPHTSRPPCQAVGVIGSRSEHPYCSPSAKEADAKDHLMIPASLLSTLTPEAGNRRSCCQRREGRHKQLEHL